MSTPCAPTLALVINGVFVCVCVGGGYPWDGLDTWLALPANLTTRCAAQKDTHNKEGWKQEYILLVQKWFHHFLTFRMTLTDRSARLLQKPLDGFGFEAEVRNQCDSWLSKLRRMAWVNKGSTIFGNRVNAMRILCSLSDLTDSVSKDTPCRQANERLPNNVKIDTTDDILKVGNNLK